MLGARRSLRALLGRFKDRCERHDRERLLKLSIERGTNENRLTEELTRWLFDEGLNPLSRPLVAGLEPDVLEPFRDPTATLYVEAKQYKVTRGTRSKLIKGFWQLCDTVHRLRGHQFDLTEAFYVVFRRGGALFELPREIPFEGWTAFPLLIDLAPAKVVGSRQREQPQVVSESELRPTPATRDTSSAARTSQRRKSGRRARRRLRND